MALSTRAAFLSSEDMLQGTAVPSTECSGAQGLQAALDRGDSSVEGNRVEGKAAGGGIQPWCQQE